MSNKAEIAERIVQVLFSPETVVGFWEGILSVPKDFAYLTYGFLDTDSYYERSTERERIIKAVEKGILERHHIARSLEIIFEMFNQYLPVKEQNNIYGHVAGAMLGRAGTNSVLSRIVIALTVENASVILKNLGTLASTMLLMAGMSERCMYVARELRDNDPDVYYSLRPHYYDLLYFLIEPVASPFVEALRVYNIEGQPAFNEILKYINEEIQRRENTGTKPTNSVGGFSVF
ncbi:hypothetical protein [Vibrio quintilis]|uniref:Uncharacterized protein n=1 Tax=Vibrio quintilis TaxID=1117707 RepID=A0A1M7YXS4_9VIBR|nr:hypothetical protein [Vibrio quintilis]SHO57489.1 hypothetical protein VQ7734_03259 [Vibrio quintilis]